MNVRVSTEWQLHGFQALVLENRLVRVVILPELGGKIWSIVSKPHDREMLWHNPRMDPRAAPYGATYDNWFSGGWDEIFPNDYPVSIQGEPYPDHGEVWSLPARWDVVAASDTEVAVSLEHRGVAIDSMFRKVVRLVADEANVRLRYEIRNGGSSPLEVHWKLHPALQLEPGARLHLPARRILVDDDFAGSFAEPEWRWPHAPMRDGTTRDASHLPEPEGGDTWFFYGLDLTSGCCAVSYPNHAVGFGLTFDPAMLSSVWVFASFGGWRGLSTIILEPCTGYRARLDRAIEGGSALRLDAGTTCESAVVMSILGDEDDVATFQESGGHR